MKYPFRLHPRKVVVNTTLETLETDFVPQGQWWHIGITTFVNKTETRGDARIYIKGHGYKHYVAEHSTPTKDTYYHYPYPIDLVPGEQLAIEQDSCGAADIMEAFLTGHWSTEPT